MIYLMHTTHRAATAALAAALALLPSAASACGAATPASPDGLDAQMRRRAILSAFIPQLTLGVDVTSREAMLGAHHTTWRGHTTDGVRTDWQVSFVWDIGRVARALRARHLRDASDLIGCPGGV